MEHFIVKTWLIIEVFSGRIFFSTSYPNKKEVVYQYKFLKKRYSHKKFKISVEKAQCEPDLLEYLLE